MPALSCPTIFLPGIMGSALRDEYPVDPETVWSPFKLAIKAYDRITAHPTDVRFELQEPARVAADKVFEVVYGELIEELRHNLSPESDQPVPVYPFPYDWRQPLENIERSLGAFIDEVIDRTRLLPHYRKQNYGAPTFPGRVNLVAHSMGGLIVAGYAQAAGLAKVDRVATIASPFRGSIEAVAKTALGVSTLAPGQGGSREREAARVTPALYYLLPSYVNDVSADPGLSDDLYDENAWQPGIVDSLASFVRQYGIEGIDEKAEARRLLGQMLAGAATHRARLEKLRLANSKMWLCVVGVGAKTRTELRITNDHGSPYFSLTDDAVRNGWGSPNRGDWILTGDNTVPYLGARCAFIPTEQVVCVTPDDFGFWEFKDKLLELAGLHSALPNMNLVQRLVTSHLKAQPYGDVWGRRPPNMPAGAAWDPPIGGLVEK